MPGLWNIFFKCPFKVPKEHVIHAPGRVSTRSASKPTTRHLPITGSDSPFEGTECSQEEGTFWLSIVFAGAANLPPLPPNLEHYSQC